MQIHDLIKTLDQMSDEELLEHVRGMRHRRETLRPVAAKKAERAETKSTRTKVKKAVDLTAGLSEEQKAELIKLLGGV